MTAADVADAMIASAHLALYESSAHELDATDDELRAAIAAAINASGCVLVPEAMIWDLLEAIDEVRCARRRGEENWNALNAADDQLRGLLAAGQGEG